MDEEARVAFERTQELLAQKKSRHFDLAAALKFLALDFVRREDPVAKADRNVQKALHVEGTHSRAKHAVNHRDRGACQYKMPDGKLCGAKLWVHHHHIKPKSEGGEDTKENLVTLCSSHHRLVHAH